MRGWELAGLVTGCMWDGMERPRVTGIGGHGTHADGHTLCAWRWLSLTFSIWGPGVYDSTDIQLAFIYIYLGLRRKI